MNDVLGAVHTAENNPDGKDMGSMYNVSGAAFGAKWAVGTSVLTGVGLIGNSFF